MVALRKDVKVGLTIGAIAVSVIGVYAGLSAVATDKPAEGTAKLETVTPLAGAKRPDGGNTTGTTSVATRTPARPDATRAPTNAPNPPTGTSTGNTGATADAGTRVANADDPWAAAFGSGRIAPSVTVTPEPGKPSVAAANSTNAGGTNAGGPVPKASTPAQPGSAQSTAADRAETIKSINGVPATPDASRTSADASGAIASGTGSPVLTRTGVDAAPAIAAPGATSAIAERTHTVEPGETFSAISSEYYGEARYFEAIIAANPRVDPNKLKPGTVITIPALAKRAPKSDTVDLPAASSAAVDPAKQYVVKPGDSLHKIATTLWGDTTNSATLYETNKTLIGADPARLKVGSVLALPTPPTQKPGT